MAKGKSSGHSIKRIEHALKLFLATWNDGNQRKNGYANTKDWPAPYQIAILRGEGILRDRFFRSFIPSLPVTLDSAQTIQVWNTLVEHNNHIEDLMNRIGIHSALRRESALPETAKQESRALYTILLTALEESAPQVLLIAVDQFLFHYWKQQFAQTPSAKPKKKTPEQLKSELTTTLRKKTKKPVEIKESFREIGDADQPKVVRFALLMRESEGAKWEVLTEVDRPRLTTARLAAYETVFEGS